MPLRSLVFSSDGGTARVLGHALSELGMQVQHCPEIFEAVERLTLEAFDVIVVDWADEPEASFLLQAAHELKSKQPPFSVAIVDVENHVDDALRAGANQVLVKGQAKQDLFPLQNQVKGQQATSRIGDVVYAQEGSPMESAPGIPAATFADTALPNRVQETDVDLSFMDDLDPPKKRRRRLKPVRHLSGKTRRAGKGALAAAALLLAVFFSGWRLGSLFRPELTLSAASRVAARVQQARARVSSEIQNWLGSSQSGDMAEASVTGEIAASPPPARKRLPLPKPSAAVTSPQPPEEHVVPAPIAPGQSTASMQPPVIAAEALSDPIPESLKQPPQLPTVRSVVASFPGTLLGALEPVLLPEEISRKLLIQKTQPSYPEQALRAGLQGPVVLQAWIGRDGKIRDLKLVRGYLVLGRAAFEAVKQWRFQPYYLNGQPMETQTYITVNFDLPLQAAPSVSNQ